MTVPIQDMQVDRCCFEAFMAQQILYGSDVVAILQKVSCKGMT